MYDNSGSEIDNRLPYRKGWPKPLPILPLRSKHLHSQEVYELRPNMKEIDFTVGFILQRYGVKLELCFVGNRFNEGHQPAPENVTMVVSCKRMENLSVTALVEIRYFLQNNGWPHRVEFIDEDEAIAPFRCISPDNPIVRKWEENDKQQILHIIKDLKWQTVDVFHCGTAIEKDKCPVTVIISAWDAVSDVWWEQALPNIRAQCGLEVRLQQASSMKTTDYRDPVTRLALEAFAGRLAIGASLGPHGEGGTGTLGGFMEMEWPDGKKEWLGLTNYHVVTTDPLAEAVKANSGYFPPNHPLAKDSSLLLASPTNKETNIWLSSVSSTITQLETGVKGDPQNGLMGMQEQVMRGEVSKANLLQQNIATIHKLRNHGIQAQNANREAGSVLAGSGYFRTREFENLHWRLDWALVRLPKGRSIDTALETHDMFWCELDRCAPKFDQWMTDNRVFKKGRTTGYTEGRVNSILTLMNRSPNAGGQNNPPWWPGSAGAVIDSPDPAGSSTDRIFASQGDSGALILDANRQVIGLLFANNCNSRITYFTPISVVMDDIEFVTGGRILTPKKDTEVPSVSGDAWRDGEPDDELNRWEGGGSDDEVDEEEDDEVDDDEEDGGWGGI